MDAPISKAQVRAIRLAGITGNFDTYNAAAEALDKANLRRDGVPAGMNWRQSAKLSDAELIVKIRVTDEDRGWYERPDYY